MSNTTSSTPGTATVLDLAVRGHLLITELPRAGAFKPTEWTLTRRDGRDALRPYEARLLDALGVPEASRAALLAKLRDLAPGLVAEK